MDLGLMLSLMNLLIFFGVSFLGLVLAMLSFFKRVNIMSLKFFLFFLFGGYNLLSSVLLDCVDLWKILVSMVVVSSLFVVVIAWMFFVKWSLNLFIGIIWL